MKTLGRTKIIGIDHGFGNILCKGKYNPDKFEKMLKLLALRTKK